jgi:hypothetical protein
MFKVCPDCRVSKPTSEFGKNATLHDGLQFYCKACCSRRSAEVYRRKRARMGKSVRERREVPVGHKYCPDCQQVKPHAEWYTNRRARDGFASYCKRCDAVRNRESYLRRTFGLTEEELQARVTAQGGVCAICRDAEPQHIDHDHKTGRVRGVLCGPCNMGLGLFADNVDRLQAAIDYLDATRRRLTATMHAVEAPDCCVIEVAGALHRAA